MTTENQTTETAATTDITTLPPAKRALIVMNSKKTEADLKAMVEQAKTVTEVSDPDGRAFAHSTAMKLKNARIHIEKTGKTAREDATAFSKAVIDEEKRLKAIAADEEARVFALRDGYDAKIEAEKAAKAAAEAARVAEIQSKIAGIRALPLGLAGETSEVIEAEMGALAAFTPSEEAFQEFTEDCKTAISECILALDDLLQKVRAQEQAAAAAIEAKRVADEALAAERAAIEAERAAFEAERAAFEAERAAMAAERAAMEASKVVLPVVDQQNSPVVPVEPAQAATETVAEPLTHPNGAPMYSTTTFKENGQPIMLDDQGKRSVFCDIADDDDPEFTIHDKADELPVQLVGAEPATDWKIRQYALHTADQFDALSLKVNICGQVSFAVQLHQVAVAVREGQFDAALAGADINQLVAFDNQLIDATVNAVDALGGGEVQAAA